MSSNTERRERTVCEACGLPFYAAAEGCPYCAAAGADPADETEAAPAAETAGRGGLLSRVRRALGL